MFAEIWDGGSRPGVRSPAMARSKKVLLALMLAFAVSTTSVSCLPINIPSCPAGGSFVGC